MIFRAESFARRHVHGVVVREVVRTGFFSFANDRRIWHVVHNAPCVRGHFAFVESGALGRFGEIDALDLTGIEDGVEPQKGELPGFVRSLDITSLGRGIVLGLPGSDFNDRQPFLAFADVTTELLRLAESEEVGRLVLCRGKQEDVDAGVELLGVKILGESDPCDGGRRPWKGALLQE